MAINIIDQPASDDLVAAYRPILFLLDANQLPNNTGAAPVVYADIYFDGVYYSSLSVTDYDPLVVWIFAFNFYTIDIQDKVQEYLKSKFARMYEQTDGDMERLDYFSCQVVVKFREGYVDTNGFTQTYGTAPVQGTKTSAPVAGTGTATSVTFYATNSGLTHEDNPDFLLHLAEYKDPFQTTQQLSHRPNYMTYIEKIVGGGKYNVTKFDDDFIFWFQDNTAAPLPYYLSVIGKYKNGTTFNTWPSMQPLYNPSSPLPNKVYSFNAGIPNLRKLFAYVQWDNVVEYEVFVFDVFFQAARQYYYVTQQCQDEYKRVFFLNSLGTWDGINVECIKEINKTSSEQYQAAGRTYWDGTTSKAIQGVTRMQPKQSDLFEATCKYYSEKDMYWLKELLATPRAYIQWSAPGQPKSLLPITIEDIDTPTLKTEDRYEYVVTLKFRLSNERINLRN